jgi:isoleucyl-tRNA synthetase
MFEIWQNETIPQREKRILDFWEKKQIFEELMELRKNAPRFSFYDGPPFATGLPHYGHLLAGTIKDVIPRYKSMKGYFVPRRFGWDCHGLPIENEIEKAQQLSGAGEIEAFGMANFNEECRKIVLRYTADWEETVFRMGRWVEFKNAYKTMDREYMESVWSVLSDLYQKGLVYEGFKVMPFSAKLGTPLSNFEANLNYKEVDDPSLTVEFPLVDDEKIVLLAWTTTPWTLPSNLALAVRGDLEYVKVKDKESGKVYILAESRLGHYFKDHEIIARFTGDKLVGLAYKPLFSYFVGKVSDGSFTVLADPFVGAEDGTGIVHLAPAFGESDFFVCKERGIEVVCPVDQNGKFTKEVPDFVGLYVKDADKGIIKKLKDAGRVFQHTQIRHRYPYCWRSDTPLIYKAVRTWFVAVEKIKDRLIAANQKIHWVPENIKEGRFGKWLENARDWAISRNRYWGTPIPIWRSESGDIHVISSVAELEELSGEKITDLHRHHIDHVTFFKEGKVYKRIPEVFDCWFESGSMPYAQNHYPFENEKETMETFPADFIAEGLDQTRGWFYTLTVLAVALFDKPAFKNVIVNGIILAEDGNKMSKRLKNYPEPQVVIDAYGADSIRLYLLNSPAVKADDLRFSERGVELVLRQFLIPYWNSYVFFATYAKIYEFKPNPGMKMPQSDIDKWILSCSQKLVKDVTESLDRYELSEAIAPLVDFIDQLTNWYIRRCRSRFWADLRTQDRDEAFEVLYRVLKTLSKVAAPFIPFLSEEIYLQLRQEDEPLSVHHCLFPEYDEALRTRVLEMQMQHVQTVVSIGHSLRKEHKVKVRQPLSSAHVICSDSETLKALEEQRHLIAEELNVKHVIFRDDETEFVILSCKPNFRTLGKKVGKKMNALQGIISRFGREQLEELFAGKDMPVEVEGERIVLTPEDVTLERKVKEGVVAQTIKGVTVALNLELDEALLKEGLAREIVNKINSMRRDEGFDVVDRIVIHMKTTDRVKECFATYREYICHEVLAKSVHFEECTGTEWDLNGEMATIKITEAL